MPVKFRPQQAVFLKIAIPVRLILPHGAFQVWNIIHAEYCISFDILFQKSEDLKIVTNASCWGPQEAVKLDGMDLAAATVAWVEDALEQKQGAWSWADVAALLAGLHGAEIPPPLPSPALERGLRHMLDVLPDLAIDVPKAPGLVCLCSPAVITSHSARLQFLLRYLCVTQITSPKAVRSQEPVACGSSGVATARYCMLATLR